MGCIAYIWIISKIAEQIKKLLKIIKVHMLEEEFVTCVDCTKKKFRASVLWCVWVGNIECTRELEQTLAKESCYLVL